MKFLLGAAFASITLALLPSASAQCVAQPIVLGATVTGTLAASDCIDHNPNGQDYYLDAYEFEGVSGQLIAIVSNSSAVDTDLLLLLPNGTYFYDDDSGGGTNAMIPSEGGSLSLPIAGRYQILISSAVPLQTGVYALTLATRPAAQKTVIEFYNSRLAHYFMTADQDEAAAIDGDAAGPDWARTGYTFRSYADGEPGNVPVCRFYGTPGLGPNSHFYTGDPTECGIVAADPGWMLENDRAFAVPAPQSGVCPVGTQPIFRAYNNGAAANDSNHRFTPNPDAYQSMGAQGWLLEGIVMCTTGSTVPSL
ncbi:MAG: hypothetical protein ABIQ06_04770 [Caldimonas sp.]